MHGVVGKPPDAAANNNAAATSKIMLLMLVAMTGVAPISLYMLVPALPVLATTFGGDIAVAQMTVSLYMVGVFMFTWQGMKIWYYVWGRKRLAQPDVDALFAQHGS